jgi:hypothetical protein
MFLQASSNRSQREVATTRRCRSRHHATLVLYTCTNDDFYVRIRRTIPRQRRQRDERELLELEEAANAAQAQADHEAETLAALDNAARDSPFPLSKDQWTAHVYSGLFLAESCRGAW